MNIGDRVRFLHSSEEGLVVRILPNQIVEVEIEEGFAIPIKQSELVTIAKEESRTFDKGKNSTTPTEQKNESKGKAIIGHKGIYCAFIPLNDQKYSLHLINNTDYDLPATLSVSKEKLSIGYFMGILQSRMALKAGEFTLNDFENWGVFVFQFLFFSYDNFPVREPFVKKMRFRAATFFNSKQQVPVMQKEGFLFQLDKDDEPVFVENKIEEEKKEIKIIDALKIREELMEKKEQPVNKNIPAIVKTPPSEVDLHIEALSQDFEKMNSNEILELQLKTFEQALENAIVKGIEEIVFIHGVGSGRLRQEIHRILSKHKDIKFFKDAGKEKFGYGATLVAFK